MTERVLILGGTAEANEVAVRLAAETDTGVTLSLAGRTTAPDLPDVDCRIGGFGGAEGLAAYIAAENVVLIVDATHPYATGISKNAAAAAMEAGVPVIRLVRPAWTPGAGDNWRTVDNEAAAADALPVGATVFLALGRQYLEPFGRRRDVQFIYRTVDGQDVPLPPPAQRIFGKPTADPAAEVMLFTTHRVTHLVCRNSGGRAGYGKIAAARQLGLPVLMIARPDTGIGETVSDVESALTEIHRHLA